MNTFFDACNWALAEYEKLLLNTNGLDTVDIVFGTNMSMMRKFCQKKFQINPTIVKNSSVYYRRQTKLVIVVHMVNPTKKLISKFVSDADEISSNSEETRLNVHVLKSKSTGNVSDQVVVCCSSFSVNSVVEYNGDDDFAKCELESSAVLFKASDPMLAAIEKLAKVSEEKSIAIQEEMVSLLETRLKEKGFEDGKGEGGPKTIVSSASYNAAVDMV